MRHDVFEAAFTAEQRARLDTLVHLVAPTPFEAWHDADAHLLADVEVIVGHWGCPPLDEAALARMPRLGLLAYAAGSVKEGGIISASAIDGGITVTSAAAANAMPVAEYALAAILLANKGAFVIRDHLRDPTGVKPRSFMPVGNYGKRVGIVGASRVGRRLIELLRPFDLDVVVCDPYLTPAAAAELGVELRSLDELLTTSDVVSIHAPFTPATAGLIGAAQLAAMRDGAVLINTARGRLVDTAALEAEVLAGRISVVLDVTWPEPLDPSSPLMRSAHAFVTPHIAGSMGNELCRLADAALDEVDRYVHGEPPRFPIRSDEFDQLA